jgi:copper chaperone CopZ
MIIVTVLLLLLQHATGQFRSATIGVNGLTCSACSYGVERALRQLDFVAEVKTDLNSTTSTVFFHTDKEVAMEALVKSVYQAGFSVRSVNAVYFFDQEKKVVNDTLHCAEGIFYFFNPPAAPLAGEVPLQLVAEKYMDKKSFRQWDYKVRQVKMKFPITADPLYFVKL